MSPFRVYNWRRYMVTFCPQDCSAARIVDYAAPLGQKAGVGAWNDLDMLEVRLEAYQFQGFG